jgi:hypothetical protein
MDASSLWLSPKRARGEEESRGGEEVVNEPRCRLSRGRGWDDRYNGYVVKRQTPKASFGFLLLVPDLVLILARIGWFLVWH